MSDPSPRELGPEEYPVAGGDRARRKAAYRLMGNALDPDAITAATGLKPGLAHRRGEARPAAPGRELPPWRSGLWSLDTENALSARDNNLDEHLTWLLDQLEPHLDKLLALSAEQGLTADFYCGYFMQGWNRGFVLETSTLARIANLQATLGVDIYAPDGDEEQPTVYDDA